ncbi:O-methyltransferase [Roseivirga sp.]|uniref:O-methyltransferase n=1 Tax=Roseivirga sp. TaxID=1964215 RepID=UPI003B51C4FF
MFQVLSFIRYWLLKTDEHSLHSPSIFQLYTEVIKNGHKTLLDEVEVLRRRLVKNSSQVEVTDFGAGSRVNQTNYRTLGEIAKNASTPASFSALLRQFILHFQYQSVLELGTSLGLNTLYLSEPENVKVTTFEGDPTIARQAENHFQQFDRKNIRLIQGNIDETLPNYLNGVDQIDLAYIDANHRFEPTVRYFEQVLSKTQDHGLIVLDDIHWSKEMNQAWTAIQKHPKVQVSIDLFEAGLLLFDPKLTKADYTLHFNF